MYWFMGLFTENMGLTIGFFVVVVVVVIVKNTVVVNSIVFHFRAVARSCIGSSMENRL